MNILVPPLRGLALVFFGELQPGLDIVRCEDRFLTEFPEIDVPSVEGTLDGLDAGFDLGCLAEHCHGHRVLCICLHDEFIETPHKEIHLRSSERIGATLLLARYLFHEEPRQDRLVAAKTKGDLGRLGARHGSKECFLLCTAGQPRNPNRAGC